MTKQLRVKVERLEGIRENGHRQAIRLRAQAPGLGQMLSPDPRHLLAQAPRVFNTRRRFLGRKLDELTDTHVDPQQHMFLPLTLEV